MLRQICTLIFKASGWKFVNQLPDDLRSFIFLGGPHTSNHDIVPALAVATLMKRNSKFVIKSEWLKFPLCIALGPAGGVGIYRSKLKDADRISNVDAMANLFKIHKDLALMIAPEGTRGPNDNWKTGFYHIAQKANVPIVLGYADYEKKEAGLGPVIYPTDFEKDMRAIMDFFRDKKGKHPENFKLDKRFS